MSELRFGVQFRNFPRRHEGGLLRRMIEAAERSESLGFDSLWMIDHLEMRPPISNESQPIPDCWSVLSALASCTSRIRVGSLVSCTLFRSPRLLAKSCETVQEISSGRLIVGIGSGWFEDEFRRYGIYYPTPKERISATRTTANILRAAATNPAFPVWIGGSGEKSTLKLVASQADGCSLFGNADIVRKKLEILDRYCSELGREKKEITKSKHSNVVIAESEAEVERKLRHIVSDETKWKNFRDSNIVGLPGECLEQVRGYIRAGVNYLTLSFPDWYDLNCLEIFSTSVIDELGRKGFGS